MAKGSGGGTRARHRRRDVRLPASRFREGFGDGRGGPCPAYARKEAKPVFVQSREGGAGCVKPPPLPCPAIL